MTQNNCFPKHIIYNLRKKLTSKQKKNPSTSEPQLTQTKRKWITFTYYSPLIRKVNNLFKQTKLNIAFRTTNTIYQQLSHKPSNINPSGVYELKCNTCNKAHIGQTGSSITIRDKERIRYIRTNNPTSCAMHILDNRHEYGTVNEILKLLQPCKKGNKMNCLESLHIQTYCQLKRLITDTKSATTTHCMNWPTSHLTLSKFPDIVWCM
jgi:hypothetical protein